MGQYYKIINLDRKEFITPWTFNDGAKLLEFGSSGSGAMLALAVLLASGNNRGGGDLRSENPIVGSWAGDKIIISGDYDDFIDEVEFNKTGRLVFIDDSIDVFEKRKKAHKKYKSLRNLYDIADHDWKDISIDVIRALMDDRYLKDEYSLSLLTRNNDRWPEDLKNSLKGNAAKIKQNIDKNLKDFDIIKNMIDGIVNASSINDDIKKRIESIFWSVNIDIKRGNCPW